MKVSCQEKRGREMVRSRAVNPEFRSDEGLAELWRCTRPVYIGLGICSDNYGVTQGNAARPRGQIFPYDDIGTGSFTQWLKGLEKEKCVVSFSRLGETHYYGLQAPEGRSRLCSPVVTSSIVSLVLSASKRLILPGAKEPGRSGGWVRRFAALVKDEGGLA